MTRLTAVFKYQLPQGPQPEWQEVDVRAGAQFVRVGQQDDVPTVWAIVDPERRQVETRRLIVVPTGYGFLGHGVYHGTTELHGGLVVVHVFEALPEIPDPPAPTAAALHWELSSETNEGENA